MTSPYLTIILKKVMNMQLIWYTVIVQFLAGGYLTAGKSAAVFPFSHIAADHLLTLDRLNLSHFQHI